MAYWNKMSISQLLNPDCQVVFLSTTNSILTGKQDVDAPPSTIDGFLSRDTCVSSTQLNRLIWNKICLSSP
jgi:hypothetical protein